MVKRLNLKKGLVILTILVLLALLVLASVSPSLRSEIQKGNLQYCEELGWINWDHARPDGPREAFRRLQRLNEESEDSFSFTYHQKMVLPLAGAQYVAEVEELWKVQSGSRPEELESVFLKVFVSVSNRFEKMQAQGAYAGLAASRESSFREGDLTGNLLAFYAAITGEQTATIQKQLRLFSVDKSLEQLKKEGIGHTKWNEIEMHCPAGEGICSELNSLMLRIGQDKLGARLLSGREGFYKK